MTTSDLNPDLPMVESFHRHKYATRQSPPGPSYRLRQSIHLHNIIEFKIENWIQSFSSMACTYQAMQQGSGTCQAWLN